MFNPKKKKLEPICDNCRLYDPGKGVCSIFVLVDNQKLQVPVNPDDRCIYLDLPTKQDKTITKEDITEEIKQVRWWTEDPETGEKTNGKGVVKIEYPPGFFGNEELFKEN